jgi:hypothetical protein
LEVARLKLDVVQKIVIGNELGAYRIVADANGAPPGPLYGDMHIDIPRGGNAVIIFLTGPDAGRVEIQMGESKLSVPLWNEKVGERAVAIPFDFEGASGRGGEEYLGPAPDTMQLVASGLHDVRSHSSEVLIDQVWDDFPFTSGRPELADGRGDYACSANLIRIWRGYISLPLHERSVLRLICHEWGGLCVVRTANHAKLIDLYSSQIDHVLATPAITPFILNTHSNSLNSADTTHPLLTDFFSRRRPSWLTIPAKEPEK